MGWQCGSGPRDGVDQGWDRLAEGSKLASRAGVWNRSCCDGIPMAGRAGLFSLVGAVIEDDDDGWRAAGKRQGEETVGTLRLSTVAPRRDG